MIRYLVVVSLVLAVVPNCSNAPGHRPYDGPAGVMYRNVLEIYSEDTKQLWGLIIHQGEKDGHRGIAPNLVVEQGVGIVDAHFESRPEGDSVHIGQDLIMSVLHIGQANTYVTGGFAPASLDRSTAVGKYLIEMTKVLAHENASSPLRLPEISEFFGMPKSEAIKLAGDDRFGLLADYQFRVMMSFILAHEYAHFALGHAASHSTPGSAQFFDEEEAADRLGYTITRELTEDNIIGAALPILFELSYFIQKKFPEHQVQELCKRAFSVLKPDVESFLFRIRTDKEMQAIIQETGNNVDALKLAAEKLPAMAMQCPNIAKMPS